MVDSFAAHMATIKFAPETKRKRVKMTSTTIVARLTMAIKLFTIYKANSVKLLRKEPNNGNNLSGVHVHGESNHQVWSPAVTWAHFPAFGLCMERVAHHSLRLSLLRIGLSMEPEQ